MRTYSVLRRVLVATGLVLYALAIAEVCVRLMKPQPLMPRYITGTAWGVRGNIPHASYRHKTQEVDVEYRINGQGMRADREVSFAKPPDTCRVALFGDSFFVGYELDLADTLAAQIELQLKSAGFDIEVLNFAVSGFGTGEMLRTYEQYAVKFDPDLVIFEWHSTDFDDNLRSGLYELNGDKLVATGRTYLPSVTLQDALMKSRLYRAIADNSQFYAWVREGVAGFVKKQLVNLRKLRSTGGVANAASNAPVETVPRTLRYPNRLSAALLSHAQQTITSSGRSFMVVDIPDPKSRTVFKATWDRLAPETVGGIELVEGADIFNAIASPTIKLSYESGHGHITPLASHALARAVASRIAAHVVPQSCRRNTRTGTQAN